MSEAKKSFGPAHLEAVESRSRQQADRERKAQRATRAADAFALLESRGAAPTKPDFRGVTSEDELRWVRLGGDVQTFRNIFDGEDDAAQDAALSDLRLSLGVAAPKSTEPVKARGFSHFQLAQRSTGTGRPVRDRLDALHAEFDRLTRERADVGERILAARRAANIECTKLSQ